MSVSLSLFWPLGMQKGSLTSIFICRRPSVQSSLVFMELSMLACTPWMASDAALNPRSKVSAMVIRAYFDQPVIKVTAHLSVRCFNSNFKLLSRTSHLSATGRICKKWGQPINQPPHIYRASVAEVQPPPTPEPSLFMMIPSQ